MTIGLNKFQFYGKLIFLIIILFLIGLIISHRTTIKFSDAPIGGIVFFVITWILVLFFLVLMTMQLIFLPVGVAIDDTSKILTLKFLFGNSLIVQSSDLNEFYTITLRTKASSYEGVVIKLTNNKEYVLSDFNLEDSKPVKAFLESGKIAFAGHQKFSFITYFFKHSSN